MEVAAQHNWTEMVEETLEEALIGRRARRHANDDDDVKGDKLSSSDEEEANKDKPKNGAGFNNNEGIVNLNAVDFHVVLNGDQDMGNHANGQIISGLEHDEIGNPKGEFVSGVCVPLLHGQNSLGNAILSGVRNPLSHDDMGNTKGEILSGVCLPPDSLGHDPQSSASLIKGSENEIRIIEEEVVELEFFDTAAVDKIQHTHNAYCPNCNSRITKVVLRRVKREIRIHDQKVDLLGCLSCFSVFVRIGKKLNPFPIFGSGGGTNSTEIAREPHLPNPNEGDDCRITMEDLGASPSPANSSSARRPVLPIEVKDSRSLEIVKCIVYGGLIEAITSLGVVSSAAAADTDTMKIVTIGVANLIGGLFVICQNLVDLKYSGGEGSNQVDRYRELLGERKHFLLHATFALLSYFVFGILPPAIYGFTFRKSDDRDYKLMAVAAASLLCVIILAAAKAYTRGANKFSKYFKTILSYVIAAGMASGVAYAAGNLLKRLMADLGWFDSKPISQNPAWASY